MLLSFSGRQPACDPGALEPPDDHSCWPVQPQQSQPRGLLRHLQVSHSSASVGDLANPRVQPREQRGVRVSVPHLPAPAGGADQQDQQDHLPQPHGQAAHGAGQWQQYRAGPCHDIIVFRCSASSFLATLTSEED